MDYYPIFVDMRGRKVLLVGGGHVALEKIGKLVDAGAVVTVIAPELIAEVQTFVDNNSATLERRKYEAGDVLGYDVVMVATDDGGVNSGIAAEARAAKIWVNAADDPANCDFILPSLVQRGKISIAASTGGSSPALARWLREHLDTFLSDEVVALGDLLAEVRLLVRARDRECAGSCDQTAPAPPLLCKTCPNRIPADLWQEAIDDDLLALLRDGQYESARERIISAMGIDRPLQPSHGAATAVRGE